MRSGSWAIAVLLAVGCARGADADHADGGSGDDASTGDAGDSGDSGEPTVCDPPSVGATPLPRLTPAQYANVVRDVLGLEVDVSSLDLPEKVGPFDANVATPVSPVLVEQYRSLAEDISAQIDPATTLGCNPAVGHACVQPFVESLGRRLFRRPLTTAETATYANLVVSEAQLSDGVRLLVQTMLQSPNFLYRVEEGLADDDGDGVSELSDYELASRLSFFLWNSGPDVALLDAAEAGMLADGEGLVDQAQRMLDDNRARTAVGDFHVQWLGIDRLPETTKDPTVYPAYDEAMAAAMEAETRRFSSAVVLQGDARLETLLTADYSYLEPPLFELYGITPPADHSPGQPVSLEGSSRAGLLTQGAFLAAHAHPNQSGPVQRAMVVRTHMLCDPPPPPPADAMVIPPEPDPGATTRERFEQHVADPACSGCHTLLDGIGMGFEGFDGIGAHRLTENGLPVDESGQLVGTDIDGPFDGVVELSSLLADSSMVHECVTRQWFRFALGRSEAEADACTLAQLDEAFTASDHDIRALLLQLIRTDAFRLRARQ